MALTIDFVMLKKEMEKVMESFALKRYCRKL